MRDFYGDLQVTTDFRRVYASLWTPWLGLDSRPILAGSFEPLHVF